MAKNLYLKSIRQQIKKHLSRFFAIIAIIALSIGFITGLLVITPNMQASLDSYYNEYNVADVNIKSELGFDSDDVQAIKEISGIDQVDALWIEDDILKLNDKDCTSRIFYLPLSSDINYINQVELKDGKFPESANEIVVEASDLYLAEIEIDAEIIRSVNGEDKTFKVVGIVKNPWFFSKQKESSRLGQGWLDTIIYFDLEFFPSIDTYSDLFLTVKDAKTLNSFSLEYKNSVKSVTDKIKENSAQLAEARINRIIQSYLDAGIDENELPQMTNSWFILDRNSNMGFVLFKENSEKISKIASIFPVFFILVATLVVLTTMTRMVEEERKHIGTLKALGYSKSKIMFIYVFFALIASLIGCLVGLAFGFRLFPLMVYQAFDSLFTLPPLIYGFYLEFSLLAAAGIIVATTITTIYAIGSVLKEPASHLLIPKTPKSGKRVFLEKVPFIWKRLKFKYKSTIRNVFRYKKHLFMTVIGIAGCMALMLTGFGLKDSIETINQRQFNEIFNYDIGINLSTSVEFDVLDENLKTYLNNPEKIKEWTPAYYKSGYVNGWLNSESETDDYSVNLIATQSDSDLKKMINLRSRIDGNELSLNSTDVIISEQLSIDFNLSIGDSIYWISESGNSNSEKIEMTISGIAENYINNYIFLNFEAVENIFNITPQINHILGIINEEFSSEEISRELLALSNVSNIEILSQTQNMQNQLLGQIILIVIVIIVSAGALAMIVLYNLTNVNIGERHREIATLKVLGYKNSEVAGYVYREIFILTILGIIVGLVLGFFLHQYIIITVDSPGMMLGRDIFWLSYIFSVIATMIFSFIVDLIMYPKIKKIDMISSLKNV